MNAAELLTEQLRQDSEAHAKWREQRYRELRGARALAIWALLDLAYDTAPDLFGNLQGSECGSWECDTQEGTVYGGDMYATRQGYTNVSAVYGQDGHSQRWNGSMLSGGATVTNWEMGND